jgi:hypothetical protein
MEQWSDTDGWQLSFSDYPHSSTGAVNGVSCVSPSQCVAVGSSDGRVFVAAKIAASWKALLY